MLDQLAQDILKGVPSSKAQVLKPEDSKCDASILIEAESIHAVCSYLKSYPSTPFNVLQVISGVDYHDYIEVCYMLAHFGLESDAEFILKIRLTDRIAPQCDSIVDLYPAANFQERECFDMLGVTFRNHPDHRRILCPDDWEGYPLRKDYLAQKTYRGMEVFPDHKMNMADREFIVRQDMIKKAQEAVATPSSSPKVQ
jgi:NADH-quinone oxidoreductase subunit C